MDEQRAIQLCLEHRDPVGFEFLVRKYRREAYFHAFALLGNQEDALDACQDSFAKAFAAIPRLSKPSQFYPWFYCILRHRCLNLLARRRTVERYRESQAHEATVAVETATPEHQLAHAEERRRVQCALASLKPEHREILLLKYVQEHHYDEIANLLNIPRGTVMSRLYHARTALREAYLNLDRAAARTHPEKLL